MNRLLLNEDGLSLSPAPDISPWGMIVSACPIIIVALLSLYLRLGNVRTLLVAASRCVIQLLLLGLLLYPIFRANKVYVVLPYVLVMILFATHEAAVKPKHRYVGMAPQMLMSIAVSLAVSLTIICFGVLKPNPWYDAQVVIPVAGMLLGSCVNALSLGMDRFLLSLRGSGGGSASFQTLVACGATRWESSLPSLREAIETGLTPNLNQMSVMGLVSIPGMFTGQILGGTPPFVAAKYQIVIMFFVCSNSIVILFLVLLQAVFFRLFDSNQAFREDLVYQRTGGKPKDIVLALVAALVGLMSSLRGKQTEEKSFTTGDDTKDNENNDPGGSPGTFRPVDTASVIHGSSSSEPLLSIKQGRISHKGRLLLTDLNLELFDGDIILIIGPSGCGKTTFLRSLALLEPLDGGTLYLGGKSGCIHATAWRAEVLYVRQSGGQDLQGTPKDFLAKLCSLQSQSCRTQDANKVEARFLGNLLALDLDREMMERRWDLMSGGEAQRIYLCMLLSLCPSVLLLDEPTSACDELAARKLEQLIVSSKIAVVWISHDSAQIDRLILQSEQASCMNYQKTASNQNLTDQQ